MIEQGVRLPTLSVGWCSGRRCTAAESTPFVHFRWQMGSNLESCHRHAAHSPPSTRPPTATPRTTARCVATAAAMGLTPPSLIARLISALIPNIPTTFINAFRTAAQRPVPPGPSCFRGVGNRAGGRAIQYRPGCEAALRARRDLCRWRRSTGASTGRCAAPADAGPAWPDSAVILARRIVSGCRILQPKGSAPWTPSSSPPPDPLSLPC